MGYPAVSTLVPVVYDSPDNLEGTQHLHELGRGIGIGWKHSGPRESEYSGVGGLGEYWSLVGEEGWGGVGHFLETRQVNNEKAEHFDARF